jgi:hypothetical protein
MLVDDLCGDHHLRSMMLDHCVSTQHAAYCYSITTYYSILVVRVICWAKSTWTSTGDTRQQDHACCAGGGQAEASTDQHSLLSHIAEWPLWWRVPAWQDTPLRLECSTLQCLPLLSSFWVVATTQAVLASQATCLPQLHLVANFRQTRHVQYLHYSHAEGLKRGWRIIPQRCFCPSACEEQQDTRTPCLSSAQQHASQQQQPQLQEVGETMQPPHHLSTNTPLRPYSIFRVQVRHQGCAVGWVLQ